MYSDSQQISNLVNGNLVNAYACTLAQSAQVEWHIANTTYLKPVVAAGKVVEDLSAVDRLAAVAWGKHCQTHLDNHKFE